MKTSQAIAQISNLIGKKVTIYTTNNMAMICKVECKISAVKESEYAQYPDGIRITYRRFRKRKDEVVWCYRGAAWEDKDGNMKEQGKELVIVPEWGGELREPNEELNCDIPGIRVRKLTGMDFKTFPLIMEKAKAIANSVIFELEK